jgi:hypothetical protein
MIFHRSLRYLVFVFPFIAPLLADAQSLELLQVYQRARHTRSRLRWYPLPR